jgi:hypothetical protein
MNINNFLCVKEQDLMKEQQEKQKILKASRTPLTLFYTRGSEIAVLHVMVP